MFSSLKKIFVALLLCTAIMPQVYAKSDIVLADYESHSLRAVQAKSYEWYFNGQKLEGVQSPVVRAMQNGQYTVKRTLANGSVVSSTAYYAQDAQEPVDVIVIGDSTASVYGSGDYPRTGWAQLLQQFFDPAKVVVRDKALSGRSSKSFLTDPSGWNPTLNLIGPGDFLIIQFGHNDQKSDAERHTDPYTTFQEHLSIYIDSALARGAHPVLATSIHRNGWSAGKIKDSHGDYPPAMRALATAKNIPLIDLHQLTETLFNSLGEDYCTNSIFMNLAGGGVWANYPDGNSDNTHLQDNGAYEVAKLVVQDIKGQVSVAQFAPLAAAAVEPGKVAATVEPAATGTVSGLGYHTIGSEVTITAKAKSNYALEGWYLNGNLVSRNNALTFTLADASVSYTAKFADAYRVSINRQPSLTGTVTGAAYYLPGDSVTVYANPRDGYRLANWSINGSPVGTDTSYTFVMGNQEVVLMATFEPATAIAESINNSDIKVFPLPVQQQLNIQSGHTIINVELVGLTGQVLYRAAVNGNSFVMGDIPAVGAFVLKVTTSQGVYTQVINK